MGFLKKTAKGVGWMGALQGLSRFISLGKTVFLARILTPAEFGLFGIVVLVIALLETLLETGVNKALIQIRGRMEEFVDTAWVVSIVRGSLIGFLMVSLAGFLANFFSAPGVISLLTFAALIPLVRGFINPAIVYFQKELKFRQEFCLRSITLLVEAIVSLILVLAFRSVFGLVWGVLTAALGEVILSFLWLPIRPSLKFEKKRFLTILSFGKWVTVSEIFSYLAERIDEIFVGRFLGVSNLGIYQMAYRISNLPFTEITEVTSKVTFPVYTKISQNKNRLRRAYLRTLLTITFFALVLSSILFLFPSELIKTFLGTRWLKAADPLRILAIFGFIRAISSSSAPLFLSVGKPRLMAKITGMKFLVLTFLLLPLISRFQLVGASLAVLFSSLSIQPIVWINIIKVLR